MVEQKEVDTQMYGTEITSYRRKYSLLADATPGIGASQRLRPMVNDDKERPKFVYETGRKVQVVAPDKTVVWEKKVPDNTFFVDLRVGVYTKLADRKVRKRNKSIQK